MEKEFSFLKGLRNLFWNRYTALHLILAILLVLGWYFWYVSLWGLLLIPILWIFSATLFYRGC